MLPVCLVDPGALMDPVGLVNLLRLGNLPLLWVLGLHGRPYLLGFLRLPVNLVDPSNPAKDQVKRVTSQILFPWQLGKQFQISINSN